MKEVIGQLRNKAAELRSKSVQGLSRDVFANNHPSRVYVTKDLRRAVEVTLQDGYMGVSKPTGERPDTLGFFLNNKKDTVTVERILDGKNRVYGDLKVDWEYVGKDRELQKITLSTILPKESELSAGEPYRRVIFASEIDSSLNGMIRLADLETVEQLEAAVLRLTENPLTGRNQATWDLELTDTDVTEEIYEPGKVYTYNLLDGAMTGPIDAEWVMKMMKDHVKRITGFDLMP